MAKEGNQEEKCRMSFKKIKTTKKSQITLFIVTGLIILVITGILLYVRAVIVTKKAETGVGKSAKFDSDIKAIKNYIETCVRDIGYEGLIKIGIGGGYIDIPELLKIKDTSYWYYNSINIQPLLNETKQRLNDYISSNLQKCTDFTVFKEQGWDISTEDISANVGIAASDVFIDINYPITIKKDNFEQKISKFYVSYDVRFRKMYELASQINNEILKPDFDRYEPLIGIEKMDVFYNNYYEGLVVILREKNSSSFDNNYLFKFGSKFGVSSLPRSIELPANSATSPTATETTLNSVDLGAELVIPAGATISLNGNDVSELSAQIIPEGEYEDPGLTLASPVYDFQPGNTAFNQLVKLSLYYNPATDPYSGAAKPYIFTYNGNEWVFLGGDINNYTNIVTIEISHLSYYTVLWTICAEPMDKPDCAEGRFCANNDPISDATRQCPASLSCFYKKIAYGYGIVSCSGARCSLPEEEMDKYGCHECAEYTSFGGFVAASSSIELGKPAQEYIDQGYVKITSPCSSGRTCVCDKIISSWVPVSGSPKCIWRCR